MNDKATYNATTDTVTCNQCGGNMRFRHHWYEVWNEDRTFHYWQGAYVCENCRNHVLASELKKN